MNQGSVYGGIVGYHDAEGIIKDSYNLGSIIGISNRYTYPGGITGNNYGTLEIVIMQEVFLNRDRAY